MSGKALASQDDDHMDLESVVSGNIDCKQMDVTGPNVPLWGSVISNPFPSPSCAQV